MHEAGFAHGDLEPEVCSDHNHPAAAGQGLTSRLQHILIASPGPNWLVKLSGFGLAWRLHSDNIKRRSRKPCYIAWEVLSSGSGNETPTFAADMWSLGCVVYELLGALLVFKDYKQARGYIWAFDFPSQRLQRLGVSEAGTKFLAKLLVSLPENRLTVAAALGNERILSTTQYDSVSQETAGEGIWAIDKPSRYVPPTSVQPEQTRRWWDLRRRLPKRSSSSRLQTRSQPPALPGGSSEDLHMAYVQDQNSAIEVPDRPTTIDPQGVRATGTVAEDEAARLSPESSEQWQTQSAAPRDHRPQENTSRPSKQILPVHQAPAPSPAPAHRLPLWILLGIFIALLLRQLF